jgi:uncharacterized membrane protein YtjA (UPF0391 family)
LLCGTVLASNGSDKPDGPDHRLPGGFLMPYWSVVFLLIAIVAGIVGFTGIAGSASGVAKLTFVIFLVLLALSLARQLLKNFELAPHKRRKP